MYDSFSGGSIHLGRAFIWAIGLTAAAVLLHLL
jgi:hypothetical protein